MTLTTAQLARRRLGIGASKPRKNPKHPLYNTWSGMHQRCTNPTHPSYPNYGAKGIRVCERWLSFATFCGDMGERPAGHTLDRIDSSRDYSPENCRWATIQQQNSNKGDTRLFTINGETATMREWARRAGLSYPMLHNRIHVQGMSIELALKLPVDRVATRRRRGAAVRAEAGEARND